MTRFARALVALVVVAAAGTPLWAGAAPRGLLPAPAPSPASTARSWPPMDATEPKAPRPSCNQGRARWTPAEVRCAIRRAFPGDASTALCIAWHESRLRPRAVGSAGERGVFQLHPVHRSWLGPTRWARLFDPTVNARAARELTETRDPATKRPLGWKPWSTRRYC